VGDGVTLTLKNITFKGSTTNNAPLIKVETGGTLVLEKGAVITGNTNTTSTTDNTTSTDLGGGVYVNSGGTLNLEDGAYITANTAFSTGGGVYVKGIANSTGGTFNMSGGEISGNKASIGVAPNGTGGGGVYVADESTFIMSGGDIKGNVSNRSGGGVCGSNKGTFTMNGGTISGKTAIRFGGGVYVTRGSGSTGVFTKKPAGSSTTSGTIYGNENTVDELSRNQANNAGYAVLGHAVFVGSAGGKRDTTAGPGDVVDSTNNDGLPD
jgi:hypothetical protein